METIDQMLEKARKAQSLWEKADQEKIDAVVKEIAKTVSDNAEKLAKVTVEETGIGNYEDNVRQDKRKAEIIWYSLKGKRSRGVISRDKKSGIVEIAKPVGVVGVVLPVTIPVTNFMANAMFSLKGGNAVILAPHPKAKRTIETEARMILKALEKFDVPEGLIQYIKEPSTDLVKELMSKVDVVVATGSMGMVKAAYASGTPAFGVGPGNVQSIADRGVDIDAVADMVVQGRVFNNGLPCACEQTVIVPAEDLEAYLEAFKKHHAHYIDDREQTDRLAKVLFTDGILSRDMVGRSATEVAARAGIPVPEDTKVLLVDASKPGLDDILRKEKLCPVTLIYTYGDFEEAIEIARANLEVEGRGHSVVIHSESQENIERLAMWVDVTRVIVNQACTLSAGGSYHNAFSPSTTLGCGFWGNNSLDENLTYKHLLNITRIGYRPETVKVPSEEEIWG